MKKIIFSAFLLWSVIGYSQPTTVVNYVTVNERRNQLALITRALNIPTGGTPSLATGQWVGFGALYADSTGGNKGIHYWNGSGWVRIYDTTNSVGLNFANADLTFTGNRTHDLSNKSLDITNVGAVTDARLLLNPTVPSGQMTANDANATSQLLLRGVSGDEVIFQLYSTDAGTGKSVTINGDGQTGIITYTSSGHVFTGNAGFNTSTLTGLVTIAKDQNTETATDTYGLYLSNATAAGAGTQSISPPIVWQGNGWNAGGGSSQSVEFMAYVLPVAGISPTGTWQLQSSINGGAYTNRLQVNSSGVVTAGSQLLAPTIGASTLLYNSAAGSAATYLVIGSSTTTNYRTTNGGSNVAAQIAFQTESATTAGAEAWYFEGNTNGDGLVFAAGNGTRQIARAGISIGSLTNTANSEAGDLIFKTQSAGAAMTEKFRILAAGTVNVGAPTADANTALNVQSLTNTAKEGIRVWANNVSTYMYYGYQTISNPGVLKLEGLGGGQILGLSSAVDASWTSGGLWFFGGSTTATAFLHVAASVTGNSAMRIVEGVDPTSPNAGDLWTKSSDHNIYYRTNGVTYSVEKTLTATATLDFANTNAGAATDLTITVTGAATGDAVTVGAPNGSVSGTDNVAYWGWVSAADTVTVRFNNNNLVNAVNPASGTFRVVVSKY
jgi:hypothetical protein